MKLIVQKRFRDKFDHTVRYQPGEMVEFEDERAADLIGRGLAIGVPTEGEVGIVAEIGIVGKPGDEGQPGITVDTAVEAEGIEGVSEKEKTVKQKPKK